MSQPIDTKALARILVGAYAEAERRILATIARRIERGLEVPSWAERRHAEIGAVRRELAAIVARLERLTQTEVRRAIEAAYAAGRQAGLAELAAQGFALSAGAVGVPLAAHSSTYAVEALARELLGDLRATHPRILREAEDVFRSIIAAAAGAPLAGAQTRERTAQVVLDRFATHGVAGFVDKAGRAWDLSSYAEMATRTVTQHAELAGKLGRFVDVGRDLVMVSGSPDACPYCEVWEGEVLSISGATAGYATLEEAEGAGLFHPNCTHTAELFTEGLTMPLGSAPIAGLYEARQQQRYLERGVRAWQRREVAALSPQARARASAKVGEWKARLAGHIEGNSNLWRERDRERVGGPR